MTEVPGPPGEGLEGRCQSLFDLHGKPEAAEPEAESEPVSARPWPPGNARRPGRGTMWITRQGWYLHGSQAHREAIEAEREGRMAGPSGEKGPSGSQRPEFRPRMSEKLNWKNGK